MANVKAFCSLQCERTPASSRMLTGRSAIAVIIVERIGIPHTLLSILSVLSVIYLKNLLMIYQIISSQ